MRIARAHEALASGRTAWASPDVLPFDGWLSREVERLGARPGVPRILSAAEEWWLWREATRELTRDAPTPAAASLADALRRADRFADEHGIDIGRWLALGGPETRLLDAARRFVRRACREICAETAARLAFALPEIGGAGAVHFAGFHAGDAPRARALFEARRSRGWPGEWWRSNSPGAVPEVELAADEADENGRLAAWCLDLAADRPEARLLVVVAGPAQRREAMARRLRATLASRSMLAGAVDQDLVAIEGGVPLARQALVGHALTSLAWLIDGLEFEDFSAWLVNPYGPLAPVEAARLDLWWRRHAPLEADARWSLGRLGQAGKEGPGSAATLAAQAGSALSALGSTAASTHVWSERFSAALEALAPAAPPAGTSVEQQARQRLADLLDEFGCLSRVSGSLDARQALRALRELATRTSWQAATGDARITIAATHDDPIVRQDGVWVAGLAAEAWPAPLLTDAFIPMPALREARVAAAGTAGRLAAAQASLEAWRASTGSLVLSVPTASGDLQQAPSPLLAAWPRRAPSACAPWLASRAPRAQALDQVDDASGNAWPACTPLPGGTRSIELQAACPFRAYAELRLGARVLDAPLPGVTPFERGRWLHRALEIFWRQTGSSERLATLSAAELAGRAASAVEAARDSAQGVVRMGARTREAHRLAGLITALAELERDRPPFRIEALEDERQVTLGAARLSARIDRIDALDGGGCAVIDYKSGQLPRQDWFSERPTSAQLLVYLAALGGPVRAIAHAQVAPPGPRFKGAAAEAGLLPGVAALAARDTADAAVAWSQRLFAWRSQVEGLAGEFLRGEAAVAPAAGACRDCHLASLCRIGDEAALDAEEGVHD